MSNKRLIFSFFLFTTAISLFAEKPAWIDKLPFTDDAFWGVGSGDTQEEAQNMAKRDILMQMSSQVKAVITMEERSNGGAVEETEDLKAFFNNNALRGAELEEEFTENNKYWALMKYCDECGDMLINSALVRFEETFNYDSEQLMKQLINSNISEIMMVERRLKELNLEDYRSEDISVSLSGKRLKIMIINFIPYVTVLSSSQNDGLMKLSATLFEELKQLSYRSISVIGHANPTGEENETEDLINLSKNRAQTMSTFLIDSGFTVKSVSWKGGDEAIGDLTTPEGMGKNRRVEIVIEFE